MAKRRTKKDKIIAQLRRQVQQTSPISQSSYTFREATLPAAPLSSQPSPSMGKTADSFLSLFSYDPTFIKKDLLRTAVLTMFAFSIEFGLYFWRR